MIAVDPLGEPGRSAQTAAITDGSDSGGWFADLLAGLGVTGAHVVGVSYGGWTALQQQLHHPGRVRALTLLDPAGFAVPSGPFYRWVVLGGMAGMLPAGLRRLAARRLVNGTLADDELMRLVWASRCSRRRMPEATVFTDAELASVAVPVQVLLGARSALHVSTEVAERLARVVPGWRVEVVPDAGHALVLDAVHLSVDRVLSFAPATPA